jgi:peptide/nickel transport system substrate-binding protein
VRRTEETAAFSRTDNPLRSFRQHRRKVMTAAAALSIGAMVLGACGSSGGGGKTAGSSGNSSTNSTSATTAAPVGGNVGGKANTGGVSGLYGSLPAAGTPTKGGTITVGQLEGSTPTDIFPIVPSADASVYTNEFLTQMFLPLYNSPVGETPTANIPLSAAASAPVFSNGDKTVTVHLKDNLKWSDGQPVTADDVLFDIDLIQAAVKASPANWSAFTPGFFPQSLTSASAPNATTLVMHLKKAYNPGFFYNDQIGAETLFPLPSTEWNVDSANGPHLNWKVPANAAKIYTYLSKLGGELSSFGTNKLWQDNDGPFRLSKFNTTNSSFTMVPNTSYTGVQKPYISTLQLDTETSISTMLTAFQTGTLDVASIDFSQLGQVSSLRSDGDSVYGYPNLGWFGAFINFKDATDHFGAIASQLYVRQALAHLVNQPGYIQGVYKNAAVAAYGPVPSVPKTPYTPSDATTAPYPYSPTAAAALLKAHGWKVVPGGQTTCEKAGTGAGECGAGIPAGTPFKFTWWYAPASQSPSYGLVADNFQSLAKQYAGINVSLNSEPFNTLVSNFNDASPADAKYTNQWGILDFGGYTDDVYPTQNSIFNTGGDYNQGAYSDATADKLINDSVFGSNPNAVSTEASYLTKDIPVLFFPNTDYVYGISKKVSGSAASLLALTQFGFQPQDWYLTK